jgi:biotin-[acetyl-CoA-carboxylase] ligase BirA-like protein
VRVQLGSIARAHGVRLLVLEEIDSTNDEARRLIEVGERGPLWVVASSQTRGRGRLGREWTSPNGNLYASFICGDFDGVAVAPQLSFVTGVAAIRALHATSGSRDFRLKWPNDLLFEGGKLGGVLLECVCGVTTPVAILGIGVNVAQAPRDLPYESRALSSLGGAAPTVDVLFAALSDALESVLDIWRQEGGFARIREEWLDSAAGLKEPIRVALARETIEGEFDTIDASGRLALATTEGLRLIEAGDVVLGPRPVTERARA